MIHLVWLTGAITALLGVTMLFKPLWMRAMITFINKGKLVYMAAGLKTVLGVIFLVMARGCAHPKVIIALGILMTFGPILFCLLSFAKIQAYMNWWLVRPVWLYRLWGIVAALFGAFVMYAGVPT